LQKKSLIMSKFKLLILIFIINSSIDSYAQNDETGTWNILQLQAPINDKWTAWYEAQTRSDLLYNHFYYYEQKAGATFALTPNVNLGYGLGLYGTYKTDFNFENKVNSEFRQWQQLVINQNVDRVKLENRFRVEQRWINGIFSSRLRYRFNITVPINSPKISPKTFFVSVFDEVFFNVTTAPYYLRNRIYGGIGYQFNAWLTLQGGLLHQFNYNLTSPNEKNFIQFSAIFRPNTKPLFHHIPTTHD
jgi:hypothetical protein